MHTFLMWVSRAQVRGLTENACTTLHTLHGDLPPPPGGGGVKSLAPPSRTPTPAQNSRIREIA